MKYRINTKGGGIFSKYMICIENLYYLKEIDNLYVNSIDHLSSTNMFDCIFKQKNYKDAIEVNCKVFQTYDRFSPIEESNKFNEYKNLAKLFKIHKSIHARVNDLISKFNIDDNTVGVHIRLTDMNIYHRKNYGYVTFEDFIKYMNPDQKYFISSDNNESLLKLKSKFGERISYIPNLIRVEKEDDNSYQLQLDNFSNPLLWHEAFIEMMLLSRCSSLICRTSNLSNAALINSNTIKNVISITPSD